MSKAKQKTQKNKKNTAKKKVLDKAIIRNEIIGLFILLIAFISLGQFGKIGYNFAFVFKLLAGSWWYLIPLIIIIMTLIFMIKVNFNILTLRNLGLLLLLLAILGYSQLNFYQTLDASDNMISHTYKLIFDNYKENTNNKAAGGLLGALVFSLLLFLFEFRGSQIILIFFILLSVILITNLTSRDGLDFAKLLTKQIKEKIVNFRFNTKSSSSKKLKKKDEIKKESLFKLKIKEEDEPEKASIARDIELVDWPQQIKEISSKTASPNILSDYNISEIVDYIKDKEDKNSPIISLKSNDNIIKKLKKQHSEKINNEALEEQIEFIARYHTKMEREKAASRNKNKQDPDYSTSSTLDFADKACDILAANKIETNDSSSNIVEDISRESESDKGQTNVSKLEEEARVGDSNSQVYVFPQYNLLKDGERAVNNDSEIKDNARLLEETLQSFGVEAKVINHNVGPSVTRFELQPAVGVKVSRVLNLTDDIALALAAKEIRIEAPIPGKSAIGIEVPNKKKSMVRIREIIDSNEFRRAESKLSICLGKDVSGKAVVADLAKMPHLLVAGSTGSGKSVCINAIIASIIYKASPDEVKMFLIDPKMVELNVYNDLPHLVTPVVTDPKQAAIILKRVVVEMERRYKLFADKRTKDLERYNQVVRQEKLAGDKGEILPQIVVIIDELADLMLVASNDVEDAICRIAQMARAAGIHLIVATQRPSVDVITGLIKANIPSRIAFTVASQTDSRTILDMGGAERLLGMGDMLFLPAGVSKPIRVQGAFISEEEIEQMVDFVKAQDFAVKENESLEEFSNLASLESKVVEIEDEFYEDAIRLVVEAGQASASYLQRRLKIGYARAARLIDYMEEEGIVSPYEGNKPREVYLSLEQLDSRE